MRSSFAISAALEQLSSSNSTRVEFVHAARVDRLALDRRRG
jgi:hypothetical protein